MKIRLIAIGSKMPDWVTTAWTEFSQRLPRECSLELHEIPLPQRGKNADIARIKRAEGELLLKQTQGMRVVALDERGKSHSSVKLSQRLDAWLHDGRDIALLVGGPDGLDSACFAAADEKWSLSALTLPHPLVRVVIAEQIYRAWSILNNHPYHRE